MSEEERKVKATSNLTQALKKITYGFYIVTAKYKEAIAAGLVQWSMQTSFNPPMVAVGIQANSYLHKIIEQGQMFAVNILGNEQKHMISPFCKPTQVERSQLNGFPFQESRGGSPLLIDCPAFIECKVVMAYPAGDHSLFIGEVVHGGVRDAEVVPLVEWETEYHYGG